MLAGVVLAGGRSKRMGQDKSQLTLPHQQTSLLVLSQNLVAGLAGDNVWVSGEQHSQGLPDVFVGCGPLSGIYSALDFFKQNKPLINETIFVPVDMPLLTVNHLTEVIEQGRKHNILCCYENHIFPLYVPISSKLIDYLALQLSAAKSTVAQGKNKKLSIRNVLSEFSAVQIPVVDASPLININTPEQWHKHSVNIKP